MKRNGKLYYGKRYLYNFLKEHGYEVPKDKEMFYTFYRGDEWLKMLWDEIEVYSPKGGDIYVILSEYDENSGRKIEKEYSVYSNGELWYQTKNGKYTVLRGKPYEAELV